MIQHFNFKIEYGLIIMHCAWLGPCRGAEGAAAGVRGGETASTGGHVTPAGRAGECRLRKTDGAGTVSMNSPIKQSGV